MSRALMRARASRFSTEGGTGNLSIPATSVLSNMTTGTVLMLQTVANVANTGRFAINRRSGGAGWDWAKRAAVGSSMSFVLDRATTDLSINALTGFLVAGLPHWIAVTWDTATLANCRVFRAEISGPMVDWTDGGAVNLGAGAMANDSGNTMRMFNNYAGTAGWPGTLHAIAIWRRVVSPQELDSARRRALASTGPAALWYPGDEGVAPVVEDWSGNRLHATINNTLTLVEPAPVSIIPRTGVTMRRVA